MTYQNDCTLPDEIVEQIAEHGLDYLPELIRTVMNTAVSQKMCARRSIVQCTSVLRAKTILFNHRPPGPDNSILDNVTKSRYHRVQ